MHSIESGFVIGPSDILFLRRACVQFLLKFIAKENMLQSVYKMYIEAYHLTKKQIGMINTHTYTHMLFYKCLWLI